MQNTDGEFENTAIHFDAKARRSNVQRFSLAPRSGLSFNFAYEDEAMLLINANTRGVKRPSQPTARSDDYLE